MSTVTSQCDKVSIHIHDDYCKSASSEMVSDIIQAVSSIISNAYSHSIIQNENI